MTPAPMQSGYVEVKDRLREFFTRYPDGCLRPADPAQPFALVEAAGALFLAYTAAAYRTPDDPSPGIGCAWEPVPGQTNFTHDSELQNAETSAWGRAIVAVGASDAHRGIATAEDVKHREADAALAHERRAVILRTTEALDDEARDALKTWIREEGLPPVRVMSATQCARVLDHLAELEGVEE